MKNKRKLRSKVKVNYNLKRVISKLHKDITEKDYKIQNAVDQLRNAENALSNQRMGVLLTARDSYSDPSLTFRESGVMFEAEVKLPIISFREIVSREEIDCVESKYIVGRLVGEFKESIIDAIDTQLMLKFSDALYRIRKGTYCRTFITE